MTMVLLMAIQALAAAAVATLGPMHTHRNVPTMLVLEDVRRGPSHGEDAQAEAIRRHGHAHGGASASRHLHAPGDGTVTLADGEAALHAGDVDDAGSGSAFSALIGLVPTVVAWMPHDASEVEAMPRAWVPQTHHPEFPERPPRIA